MRLPQRIRSAVTATLALALVAVGLVVTAPAASADTFDPGRIVSDGVFYDSGTMDAAAVQSFVRARNPGCAAGYTCLYDYTETTFTRAADAYCRQYTGASNERASQIIAKVATACGVNPRVLLVLLQKETSLVTRTAPTWQNAYRKATGYGCPDTAPCDAQYYGFYNQVYRAAWQYQRYAATAATQRYRAGQWNYIQYHPTAACGGTQVYIANQATAGLYIYTPYQPNANAIAGRGDQCSSYGNLNFHKLFTQWFGSTVYSLVSFIEPWYRHAENAALVGDPVADGVGVAGGILQRFARGNVYVSGVGGVQPTVGLVDSYYSGLGGPGGSLGFPIGAQSVVAGGLQQDFQNGSLYVSGVGGGRVVGGWIRDIYRSNGGAAGRLGFPTSAERVVAGGLAQTFQTGTVYFSGAGGARILSTTAEAAYAAAGGPGGPLGYPTGNAQEVAGGTQQAFQNGTLYVSSTSSAAVVGWARDVYVGRGGPAGALGFPVKPQAVVAGGIVQEFQNGTLHISGVGGARVVPAPVAAAYASLGGPAGAAGFPVGDATASGGVTQQQFQNGWIYATSAGGGLVTGMARDTWLAQGGATGPLGLPVGSQGVAAGGLVQRFANGSVYVSGIGGVRTVLGQLDAGYRTSGGPAGSLGFPTGQQSAVAGGLQQPFQRGVLYLAGRTGVQPVLTGWMSGGYAALGGPAGALGFPASAETAVAGGLVQRFEGGSVYVSGVGGRQVVLGALDTAYRSAGGPAGTLGFPLGARQASGDGGWVQQFQNGSIRVDAAGAATVVPAG